MSGNHTQPSVVNTTNKQKSWLNQRSKRLLSAPTVDLQASQKVSSVYRSMRLVLPTPREPMMMIWSLKSAGLGGIFLRRDWAARAGDEFAEPPPPLAALLGMSYLGSISSSTFGIIIQTWQSTKDGLEKNETAFYNFYSSLLKFDKVCHLPTIVVVQPLETRAAVTSLITFHCISVSVVFQIFLRYT